MIDRLSAVHEAVLLLIVLQVKDLHCPLFVPTANNEDTPVLIKANIEEDVLEGLEDVFWKGKAFSLPYLQEVIFVHTGH